MESIHDSVLTGYVVDGRGRTITLHTEPHSGGGSEFVDVRLHGVVAYHFESDCLENIVYEITEVSPDRIIGDGVAFAERHRLHGWPAGWDPGEETASGFLSRPGLRVFELQSSYGMVGWVAAASIEYRVVGPPA